MPLSNEEFANILADPMKRQQVAFEVEQQGRLAAEAERDVLRQAVRNHITAVDAIATMSLHDRNYDLYRRNQHMAEQQMRAALLPTITGTCTGWNMECKCTCEMCRAGCCGRCLVRTQQADPLVAQAASQVLGELGMQTEIDRLRDLLAQAAWFVDMYGDHRKDRQYYLRFSAASRGEPEPSENDED